MTIMKLVLFVVLVLASVAFPLQLFPEDYEPKISSHKTYANCVPCTCVNGCLALTSHRRLKRSHGNNVQLSPGSIPASPPPSSNVSNGSDLTRIPTSKLPSWLPTLDTIVTAAFRAIITSLTLFNVNITWRLHGKSCSSRTCLYWLQPEC